MADGSVHHRFLSFFLPLYLLNASCGIEFLAKRLPLKRTVYAVTSAMLVILLFPSLINYYRLGMQGF